MKINIIVSGFNKPDFVLSQFRLLEQFLEEDFDYYLYDNSIDSKIESEFKKVCKEVGAKYIKVPQKIHVHGQDVCTRCGGACDWAIKHNMENHKTEYAILLDADMFPIKNFSVLSEMGDNDLLGIAQGVAYGYDERLESVVYFTNQLFIMKFENLPNFAYVKKFLPVTEATGKPKYCPRTDCGGWLHFYLEDNPSVKWDVLNTGTLHSNTVGPETVDQWTALEEMNFDELLHNYYKEEIDIFSKYSSWEAGPAGPTAIYRSFTELVSEHRFLHFRAGSNWTNHPDEIVNERESNFKNFVDKLIKEKENEKSN